MNFHYISGEWQVSRLFPLRWLIIEKGTIPIVKFSTIVYLVAWLTGVFCNDNCFLEFLFELMFFLMIRVCFHFMLSCYFHTWPSIPNFELSISCVFCQCQFILKLTDLIVSYYITFKFRLRFHEIAHKRVKSLECRLVLVNNPPERFLIGFICAILSVRFWFIILMNDLFEFQLHTTSFFYVFYFFR